MSVGAARRGGQSATTTGDRLDHSPVPDPFPEPDDRSRVDLASAVGWVLSLLGFLIGARTIADNSFLTHLATGRLILETGSVPATDPYSYLAGGEAWTVQSWLVSLVYATLDATVGQWSIRVLNGVLGVAIIGGMWRLTEPARQLLTRVGLVSVVLVIGTFLWPPRPLLIGLVCMVLVLQVAAGTIQRWWLLPIFWVWVSSHGSFVLGLAALGFIMLGAALDERRPPWPEIRTVATAGAGCLLALIGPVGWRLLWFPVQMMGRSEALDRVSEWASPTFRSPVEQLFLVPLVLIVIAARRRAPWRVLLPSILFFFAGLLAVRNLGLASIVIVALLAPSMSGLVGTIDGRTTGLIPRAVGAVVAVGLLLAPAIVWAGPALDLDDYPRDEIDWLESRDLVATPGVRLAQRDYVGNYLTLRYGSDARVFMDDRFDFFPLPVVKDHAALLVGGDVAEIMGRNEFDVVLWETDSQLRRWLVDQSDWAIVSEDEDWFVACRVSSDVYARCQG